MKKFLTWSVLALLLVEVQGATEVEAFEAQERLTKLRQTLAENIAKEQQQKNEQPNSQQNGELSPVKTVGVGTNLGQSIGVISETRPLTEQEKIKEEAFYGTIDQLLPMTPKQVKKLKEVYEESQAAMATPAAIPAKPTSSSIAVDLSPRATPPLIRLGAGYISSLVFVDASGQPWPIDSYSIGDPVSFNIKWDQKGNTLLVQSSTFFKSSNLAVILKGLNTPVMITLLSGQDAIDYRVDLRVPGSGPNAAFLENAAFGAAESVANSILLDFLNGIPPAGAREVKVKGGGSCQAWLIGADLYLRTKLTVVSPGWKSVIKSIDGMGVYLLQKTPVVLASQEGRDKLFTLILEEVE